MAKTILIIALLIFCFVFIGTVMSSSAWDEREDDERYDEKHESSEHNSDHTAGRWLRSRVDIPPVENHLYKEECGGCHFAFQPGLLPANAWTQIMAALGDHYGDDATLDEVQAAQITSYLRDNAANHAAYSRSRAFAAGTANATILPRITGTDYFQREHYEIPPRLVRANAQVRSFSNCQSCHRNADAGVYNEHQVVIPGIGYWDD